MDSICSQKINCDDIEHIIVDNLSTNGTKELVLKYRKNVKHKVTYLRESDSGIYNAMNKGIRLSKGTYLSFLTAGDHFYNDRSLATFLLENDDKDIVYGNLNIIDKQKEILYEPPSRLNFKYFLNHALPHQASIIKLELFKKIGFYDETLKIVSDQTFYIDAICKHHASYLHINKTLATYYFDGISSKLENLLQIESEKNKYLDVAFSTVSSKKIAANNSKKINSFTTPILFLIFNRPDLTLRVFDAIRKIKPKFLFVAADGPRKSEFSDLKSCEETRKIIEGVDWDCEISTLYRTENFGCGNGVSKAISWFFSKVDKGIILEDDVLPTESFFNYCSELLKKYQTDSRVSHISGSTIVKSQSQYSYYFSRYFHVWGWATWRRAWNKYDFSMRTFPLFVEENQIKFCSKSKNIQNFWMDKFLSVYRGQVDTWDFQWVYANMANSSYAIMPLVNLVSNIGFGKGATHTTNRDDENANRITGDINEICHPTFVIANEQNDQQIYDSLGVCPCSTIKSRLLNINMFLKKDRTESLQLIWRLILSMLYKLRANFLPDNYLKKSIANFIRNKINKIQNSK